MDDKIASLEKRVKALETALSHPNEHTEVVLKELRNLKVRVEELSKAVGLPRR